MIDDPEEWPRLVEGDEDWRSLGVRDELQEILNETQEDPRGVDARRGDPGSLDDALAEENLIAALY